MCCEESQTVCKAFRNRGWEAYSCDILEESGGHPEWHIQQNVLPLINGDCKFVTRDGQEHKIIGEWDLLICHPPCTYLANSGAMRMKIKGQIVPERYQKAMEAKEFFMMLYNAKCQHIAIENPTPMKIVGLPSYTQAIQPYQFGHPYSKRTCLWLKNLPLLEPTKIIEKHEPYANGGFKDRQGNYKRFPGRNERNQRVRSKTFTGFAQAMAYQWGDYLERNMDKSF